ncbi:DUF222 domain-containing protein [Microlunatus soli]|nr:DUF222 domain-containing protein [Microlunatus soli]
METGTDVGDEAVPRDHDLADVDLATLAADAAACVQAEIAAGCRLLRLAACWADHHPADGIVHQRTRLAVAGERSMRYGGDGTPDIAEGAPAGLGLEIRMNPRQAASLIADAVDLRHRLPRLWRRVCEAQLPAWQARRVAFRTRTLSREQARLVDRRLAGRVGQVSRRRLELLIDAELLRADPDRAAKVAAAAQSRQVWLGQSNEYGVKDFYARMDAADAIWLDGTVDRLADILLADPERLPAGIPDRGARTKAEWRAVALGLLARPLIAARLLAEDAQPDLFDDLGLPGTPSGPDTDFTTRPQQNGGAEPADRPLLSLQGLESVGGPESVAGQASDAAADTTSKDRADDLAPPAPKPDAIPVALSAADRERLLGELARRIRPDRLAPRAVLHVHLNAEALLDPDGPDGHVVRTEDLGAQLGLTVKQWLQRTRLRVQPILDPTDLPAVDAYETPGWMADGLFERSPASVFPFTSAMGRRLQKDHTLRYRPPPAGPPGQTGGHNLGPLAVAEHRPKTFGTVRVAQPQPGSYVWRTSFGRVIITNPTGTFDLGAGSFPDALWRLVREHGLSGTG